MLDGALGTIYLLIMFDFELSSLWNQYYLVAFILFSIDWQEHQPEKNYTIVQRVTKQSEIRCKSKFINIYSSFLLILQLFDWYWLYSKAIRWERSQWQFSDWLIVAFLLLLCALSIFHFGLCTWKCSIPRATLRGGKVLLDLCSLFCHVSRQSVTVRHSTERIEKTQQSTTHGSLIHSIKAWWAAHPWQHWNEQEQKHL